MTPETEAVAALGLAIARRRGVARRAEREGWTQQVRDADRESQCEFGRALADVYHHFGADDTAFAEAREVARIVESTVRDLPTLRTRFGFGDAS